LTGNDDSRLHLPEQGLGVILFVGVNGVGKTTTIGKLAHRFKQQGKQVLLAAGDTFRAGAIEQLEVWGQRVGVDVIKHQSGADPAAVVFDAVQAAKNRKVDILLCDTAGRLQNKANLMEELNKIYRVLQREVPGAPHEVLLVLDATTGQNALSQAKMFREKSGVTGIVLTKLDGTAKGGIVIAIRRELGIPVKFVGLGEKMDDLQEFDSEQFVHALFAGWIPEQDDRADQG
jgi:fused signal recognition particle receptor